MPLLPFRYKCRKCGYEWFPRVAKPAVCANPKCHSPAWDREPMKKRVKRG